MYDVALTFHLLGDFSSKMQSSMAIFHHINVRKHNIAGFVSIIDMDFIQFSIIRDSTCKLIHKKCHSKSYHNDIKYSLTLTTIATQNMIFRV